MPQALTEFLISLSSWFMLFNYPPVSLPVFILFIFCWSIFILYSLLHNTIVQIFHFTKFDFFSIAQGYIYLFVSYFSIWDAFIVPEHRDFPFPQIITSFPGHEYLLALWGVTWGYHDEYVIRPYVPCRDAALHNQITQQYSGLKNPRSTSHM